MRREQWRAAASHPAPLRLIFEAPDHEMPLQPLAQLSQVAGTPAQAAARGAAARVYSATSHAPRGTQPKLPQTGTWEARPSLRA